MITSGLNNTIRNYDWATKLIGKNNKPGLKDFAGGLATIQPYLDLCCWDEDAIFNRGPCEQGTYKMEHSIMAIAPIHFAKET